MSGAGGASVATPPLQVPPALGQQPPVPGYYPQPTLAAPSLPSCGPFSGNMVQPPESRAANVPMNPSVASATQDNGIATPTAATRNDDTKLHLHDDNKSDSEVSIKLR